MSKPLEPNSDAQAAKFAISWDKPNEGYVPIRVFPSERRKISRFYKLPEGFDITVAGALKCLHFPQRLLVQTSESITHSDVKECSKLSFLISTLKNVDKRHCNLDVAIVASTKEVEDLLAKALELFDFQCKPLSEMFESKNPVPVFGTLVRFRKDRDKPPKFKLSVDIIMVYDSACAVHRNFDSHFKGVYYDKPKVVSLVCYHTPDIRICNYRDVNSSKDFTGKTRLLRARFEITAMFFNVQYSKSEEQDYEHLIDNVGSRLVSWMVRKENCGFNPLAEDILEALPQRGTPTGGASAVVGEKRRASSSSDAPSSSASQKKVAFGELRFLGFDHYVPEARINLLRSRIQTSFPVKGLKFPSLILHKDIIRGVDWLSGRKIVCSRESDFSKLQTGTLPRHGKVQPINTTLSTQLSTSNFASRTISSQLNMSQQSPGISSPSSSGAPTIHPSRLAMIEASQSPLSLSQPTEPQESHANMVSSNSQAPNITNPSTESDETSMQVDSTQDTNANNTSPQAPSKTDIIVDAETNETNDTQEDAPMEKNNQGPQEESDKSLENSPQTEREFSSNGLNDFEVALERAHLELMRSLLGKDKE